MRGSSAGDGCVAQLATLIACHAPFHLSRVLYLSRTRVGSCALSTLACRISEGMVATRKVLRRPALGARSSVLSSWLTGH